MKKFLISLLTVFFFFSHVHAEGISQDDPEKMVDDVAQQLLIKMEEQRSELEQNPQMVISFAETYVLPYVDAPRMARYVMGKFWRTASKKQKDAFVKAFTETLIRSYAGSLLKLNIEKVEVKSRINQKKGKVMVPSEVTQSDGNVSSIMYRLYQSKKTKKWMMYDVSIEGVSMLLNYRKSYASDLTRKGVAKVISEMEQKNVAYLNRQQG